MAEDTEQILRQASLARRALSTKSEILSSCHVWTPEFATGAKLWLENFSDTETPLAAALLDGFLYFSEAHATELMMAGFHALSRFVVPRDAAGLQARTLWADFFDKTVFTHVEGERPNATDSGLEALRKFRIRADVPQERTLEPIKALAAVIRDQTDNVVFVDDFVGSGHQFIVTWIRKRDFGEAGIFSFADVSAQLDQVRFFYCPSVCTSYGLDQIRAACPGVVVSPGTVLDERHSVLHPHSLIWPDEQREPGQAFVREISERLGVPDTNGNRDDWRGFHKLGLAIAIRETIPDAALRILRLKQTGWNPVVRERL